jgi:hypothetical protein
MSQMSRIRRASLRELRERRALSLSDQEKRPDMNLRTHARADGRPSLLTPERQALIVEALAGGASYEQAAEAGGIALRTLYLWLSKGTRRRKGDRNGPYHQFAVAVRQASAQARRAAASERRTREAEERATQPSTPRSAEAECMHLAKLLRRALHPPMPGSPEALAFEAEYSATRKRLGITRASADADDEEEQERLLQLYLRMRERDAHNSAILRGVIERRAASPHMVEDESKGSGE